LDPAVLVGSIGNFRIFIAKEYRKIKLLPDRWGSSAKGVIPYKSLLFAYLAAGQSNGHFIGFIAF
jgi:hypothetical protein